METMQKYLRILLNILIPIVVIIAICFILPKFLGFLMPFIIAGIISLIANPVVRFLEKRLKLVRKHSSVVIIVLVLSLVLIGGYYLIARLIVEIVKFVKDLPQIYMVVSEEVTSALMKFDHLFSLLPGSIQGIIDSISTNLSAYVTSLIQRIGEPTVTAAGSVAKGIPNALINFVFTIVFAYFFIAYRDHIIAFAKNHTSSSWVRYFNLLMDQVKMVIGSYLVAQMKIMVVVGIIGFIGFVILGVNYAFLLAIFLAFLDFLPVFGAGTLLIPWTIIKLLAGEYYMGIGLLGLYLVTLVVRQMIQPKILGDSMGLDPFVTMLLFYLGYKFAGLSGMILAVPVGVFLIEIYKLGAFRLLTDNIQLLIKEINSFRKGEGNPDDKSVDK